MAANSPHNLPMLQSSGPATNMEPVQDAADALQPVSPDGLDLQKRQVVPRSFLDLPAEIRNLIYEKLFVRTEPIPLQASPESTRGDVPGIQLLRTSKQMHTEVTAILYSENTFYMLPSRHFSDRHHAAAWLTSLATSSHLVSQLVVHVSFHARFPFDVLHLLRHAWSRLDGNLEVKFVRDRALNVGDPANENSDTESLPSVNKLFALVASRAHDHWRTFARLQNVLHEVTLSESSPEMIMFRFQSSADRFNCSMFTARYNVYGPKDIHLAERNPEHKPRLDNIMFLGRTYQSMQTMLATPEDPLIYDLDKRTISRAFPGISAVNQELRFYALQKWLTCHVQVVLGSNNLCAKYNDFSALEKWLGDQYRNDRGDLRFRSLTVVHYIAPNTPFQSTEFRFDVLQLLRILDEHVENNDWEVIMHLHVVESLPIGARDQTVMLKLRARLLIYIDEIFNHMRCTDTTLAANLTIWVDKELIPREAELASETVHLAIRDIEIKWDDEEIWDREAEAYGCMRCLMDDVDEGDDDEDESEDGDGDGDEGEENEKVKVKAVAEAEANKIDDLVLERDARTVSDWIRALLGNDD